MKKLFVIASLISSCILLFSCEKEPVDITGRTNGLDLNLFGGAGWCKPAATSGGATVHTYQQTNTTVGLHPGSETPKR